MTTYFTLDFPFAADLTAHKRSMNEGNKKFVIQHFFFLFMLCMHRQQECVQTLNGNELKLLTNFAEKRRKGTFPM